MTILLPPPLHYTRRNGRVYTTPGMSSCSPTLSFFFPFVLLFPFCRPSFSTYVDIWDDLKKNKRESSNQLRNHDEPTAINVLTEIDKRVGNDGLKKKNWPPMKIQINKDAEGKLIFPV